VPRCSAPLRLFSPAPGLTLYSAPQSFASLSCPGPFARTGLSLSHNGGPSRDIHSRVEVSDLILRSCARCRPRPFGLLAPPPLPVRPGGGWLHCFRPVASSTAGAADSLRNLHSPFGLLPPSGSKRSIASASLSARLAIPPDFLSLPAALCLFQALTATDHRSWFATFSPACCSSNLLEPSSL
jgi:hypothetical protein